MYAHVATIGCLTFSYPIRNTSASKKSRDSSIGTRNKIGVLIPDVDVLEDIISPNTGLFHQILE